MPTNHTPEDLRKLCEAMGLERFGTQWIVELDAKVLINLNPSGPALRLWELCYLAAKVREWLRNQDVSLTIEESTLFMVWPCGASPLNQNKFCMDFDSSVQGEADASIAAGFELIEGGE